MLFQLQNRKDVAVLQEYMVVKVGIAHLPAKHKKDRSSSRLSVCFIVWVMHRNAALRNPVWSDTLLPIEAFWLMGENGMCHPSYAPASNAIMKLGATMWLTYVANTPGTTMARRPKWGARKYFTDENWQVLKMPSTPTAGESRMVVVHQPSAEEDGEEDEDDGFNTPTAKAPNSPQGIAQLRLGKNKGPGSELVRRASNSSGDQIKYTPVYGAEHSIYNELHANSDNNMPLQMTIAAVTMQSDKILTSKLHKDFQEKMDQKDEANRKVTEALRQDYKTISEKQAKESKDLQAQLLSALLERHTPEDDQTPPNKKRKMEPAAKTSPPRERGDDLEVALKMLVSGKPKKMQLGLKFIKRMAHASDHTDLDTIYDDIVESGADVDSTDVCAQVKVQNTNQLLETLPHKHHPKSTT
jgi:hypothetical protein